MKLHADEIEKYKHEHFKDLVTDYLAMKGLEDEFEEFVAQELRSVKADIEHEKHKFKMKGW